MCFNDNPVHQVQLQKRLGLFLDPKLIFDEHIQCILNKTRKIIGLIRKLQPIILRASLLTIDKSFLKHHLDYGDVIYDRVFNKSFRNKLVCSIYYRISDHRSYRRFLKREGLPGIRSWIRNVKVMVLLSLWYDSISFINTDYRKPPQHPFV